MSRWQFRRRGGYFRWRSNDVSRDLRGCLSVSAKIDLTPHSLHHSAGGIECLPPSLALHPLFFFTFAHDDRARLRMLARNATSYVPLARRRDAPARLTLSERGSLRVRVRGIALKLHAYLEGFYVTSSFECGQRALYRRNARRRRTRRIFASDERNARAQTAMAIRNAGRETEFR